MPRLICGVQSARLGLAAPAPRADCDRLLEQVLVELDADLADMAGLLVAQQVAGAADVEVVAGELEAGAQRVQGLHHLEPLGRRRRQRLARRQGEIGVAAHLAAADAAAQLVELGQAEHVGAVDDQRVGGADVEAAFDDVGRQQQVELAVVEVLS